MFAVCRNAEEWEKQLHNDSWRSYNDINMIYLLALKYPNLVKKKSLSSLLLHPNIIVKGRIPFKPGSEGLHLSYNTE